MTALVHWLPPDGGWPPCEPFPISWFSSHDEATVTCPDCLAWLAEQTERALDPGGHWGQANLGNGLVHTYCGIVIPHSSLTPGAITCPQCREAAAKL